MKRHTRSGHSAGGPTGSPSATQVRPCVANIRKPAPESEKRKLLSPMSARRASGRGCWTAICRARSISSAVGRAGCARAGRSNCETPSAKPSMATPSTARKARGAVASNSNCHHSSCVYSTLRNAKKRTHTMAAMTQPMAINQPKESGWESSDARRENWPRAATSPIRRMIDTLGATTARPLISENGMLSNVMDRASHQAPSSRRYRPCAANNRKRPATLVRK